MNSRAFAVQDTRRLSPALVRVESLFSVSVRVNKDRPRDEPPPPGRSEWVSVSGATADSCTRAQVRYKKWRLFGVCEGDSAVFMGLMLIAHVLLYQHCFFIIIHVFYIKLMYVVCMQWTLKSSVF